MSENNTVTYEKLGLANDFMFGKIMQSERYCKPFLEQLLGISIDRIEYVERQKVIDEKVDGRSIRLDIYVEDGRTIYNCEMQTSLNRNLPKRTRYYQGQIDINQLFKGEDYENLKKTFVIFVCTFDPFGRGGCIYTFENSCREYPGLGLGDETVKIFLNTKGTQGAVSRNLKELLEYMDTAEIPENCINPLIPELDAALNAARKNEEWRREFMTLEMLKQDYMKEGRAEGLEKGREEERKEMIYYMLLDNVEVDRIARIARISVEDVLRIKEEYNL